MSDNIILIGFMGVGKGRTARSLAVKTGRFIVDTDDLIVTAVKKKIRNIFSLHGELYFRELEQQTANWLEQNVCDTIVSTGGGFFMVDNLKKLGRIVYLHSSVEAIFDRINRHPKSKTKIKKRPLLQDMEQAKRLFETRLPLYREVADYEINIEFRDVDDIVDEIVDSLQLQ